MRETRKHLKLVYLKSSGINSDLLRMTLEANRRQENVMKELTLGVIDLNYSTQLFNYLGATYSTQNKKLNHFVNTMN